jgi:mannose-6-phosphate isomerase-like protein (cupin superfamily)
MSAAVRSVLNTGAGLVRRLVEVPPGTRLRGAAGPGGELWFVLGGAGRVAAGAAGAAGVAGAVRPDTGVWLPPGAGYELAADGPDTLRLDSVELPGPRPGDAARGDEAPSDGTPGGTAPGGETEARRSELGDCPVEVTGDRRFRVLFGPGRGCAAATQFVGEIPPGRAPAHTHTYDEVVLVLAGSGVLHAGAEDRPLTPGSCLHLPPGVPHCLENTGPDTLRVLGVFHPGGSPAAKREGASPAAG